MFLIFFFKKKEILRKKQNKLTYQIPFTGELSY